MVVRRSEHPPPGSRIRLGGRLFGGTWVVSARSEDVVALWADPAALLTCPEQDRARRFRFDPDRRDFVAAHILARVAGAGVLGVDPRSLTLAQRCRECGAAHGRPFFSEAPALGVSLSHTRGYVAAAVGTGPVGVDAEGAASAPLLDEGLASEVLAPGELELLAAARDRYHAFIRLWVRKEAMVKCGRGSLDALASVDVSTTPLVDVSSSPACTPQADGLFLLEWRDAKCDVVGAAVTPHAPQLTLLRRGRTGPELHDIPVAVTPLDRQGSSSSGRPAAGEAAADLDAVDVSADRIPQEPPGVGRLA